MTTLSNKSGSKKVHITNGGFAQYVQVYQGNEQVLQSKHFASVSNATKWGNKILEN